MPGQPEPLGTKLALPPRGPYVAETAHYRISRYWLRGHKAGTAQVFVDNIACFPDNLSISNGILWVPMASPRQAMVDMMLPSKRVVCITA